LWKKPKKPSWFLKFRWWFCCESCWPCWPRVVLHVCSIHTANHEPRATCSFALLVWQVSHGWCPARKSACTLCNTLWIFCEHKTMKACPESNLVCPSPRAVLLSTRGLKPGSVGQEELTSPVNLAETPLAPSEGGHSHPLSSQQHLHVF
jgi:hypothetical protein